MSGLATGIASAAISLGGSVGSFIQAGKRNNDMQKAEAAANAAMAEARKRTETNFMKELGIQTEAYEQAYRAGNVASTAALQAAVDSDQRGAASAAGRITQAGLENAQKVRAAQEGEMVARQQAIVSEESRLRDINIQLDLSEAQGAQQAAADAALAKGMAIQEGISGLSAAAMTGAESIALYPKKGGKDDAINNADGNAWTEIQRMAKDKESGKTKMDMLPKTQMKEFDATKKIPSLSFDETLKGKKGRQDAFRSWMHDKHKDYVGQNFVGASGKNVGKFSKSGYYDSEHLKDAFDKYGQEFVKQKGKYLY